MKFELKRVGIWSTVKTGFFIWGLLGFLGGIYMALMLPLMVDILGSMGSMPGDVGDLTSVGLIFLPFMYSIMAAVFGTIMTVIVVGFYNLICKLTGGIELELAGEQIEPLDIPRQSLESNQGFEGRSEEQI